MSLLPRRAIATCSLVIPAAAVAIGTTGAVIPNGHEDVASAHMRPAVMPVGPLPAELETTTSSSTTTTTTLLLLYVHEDPNVERWHLIAREAGWEEHEWPWLSCVIWKESRGRPDASNGQHRGLMQIASKVHEARIARAGGNADSLYDPQFNLSIALQMFREGQGTRPWSQTTGGCPEP